MSGDAPDRDDAHRRPEGVSDAAISCSDTVTQAVEFVERARGALYEFHHLIGRGDLLFTEGADQLAELSHPELAELIRTEIIGRNVVGGKWTFQVVEEFDEGYWTSARSMDEAVRAEITGGRRHVFEAELKERNRTPGKPGHERDT